MKLVPLNNNVILAATPDYKSDIVLTEQQREDLAMNHQYQTTKVVAVGDKVRNVKAGDLVLFRITAVSRFKLEAEKKGDKPKKYFLCVEDLLICKLK